MISQTETVEYKNATGQEPLHPTADGPVLFGWLFSGIAVFFLGLGFYLFISPRFCDGDSEFSQPPDQNTAPQQDEQCRAVRQKLRKAGKSTDRCMMARLLKEASELQMNCSEIQELTNQMEAVNSTMRAAQTALKKKDVDALEKAIEQMKAFGFDANDAAQEPNTVYEKCKLTLDQEKSISQKAARIVKERNLELQRLQEVETALVQAKDAPGIILLKQLTERPDVPEEMRRNAQQLLNHRTAVEADLDKRLQEAHQIDQLQELLTRAQAEKVSEGLQKIVEQFLQRKVESELAAANEAPSNEQLRQFIDTINAIPMAEAYRTQAQALLAMRSLSVTDGIERREDVLARCQLSSSGSSAASKYSEALLKNAEQLLEAARQLRSAIADTDAGAGALNAILQRHFEADVMEVYLAQCEFQRRVFAEQEVSVPSLLGGAGDDGRLCAEPFPA